MTAEPVGPVDLEQAEPGDAPAVGSVGEELALLLQLLTERSTVPHPVVQLVRDHPELVEHAADTLVSWIRGAQDALTTPGEHR